MPKDYGPCGFQPCRNMSLGPKRRLCDGHYRQQKLGKELTPLKWVRRQGIGDAAWIRDPEGRKECRTCTKFFPVQGFFSAGEMTRDGVRADCKRCAQDRKISTRYGMSYEEYIEFTKRHGNKCALCGGSGSDTRRLAVDHDHGCCPTGRGCGSCNRGLLCSTCNTGLGQFKDDTALLQRAIDYLKQHRGPR